MTYPYSIDGLGGLGYSAYSSYDPMMMGMYNMNGVNGMGAYGGYGMGMMGMYNPTYLNYYNQAQQQIEKSQVQHSADMHDALKQAEVSNMSAEDRAFFQKLTLDGGIRANIKNLATAIRSGDQDAVCRAYDKTKQNILTKYSSDFRNNLASMDAEASVRNAIDGMYSEFVRANGGGDVDLMSDIKRYGETPIGHGVYKGFATGGWLSNLLGKEKVDDYHKRYTEETIDYIWHLGVDNKYNKDKMKDLGVITGKTLRTLAPIGIGALIGGIRKGKVGAGIGAAIGFAGDFLWQSL